MHYSNDKRVYNRRDGPYIVLSQRSPTTLVVASCEKPDETLRVYHTSALTPCLNGAYTQSPIVPLKKRGRPCKQPLIPRGTAGVNAIMSARTQTRRDGLLWCRGRIELSTTFPEDLGKTILLIEFYVPYRG
ncbi:transposon Tf2-8 polyprotein [Trichonephila clavipes]|nr:transposon Tf2-8 polyprotein [Trichonephila clavipes]